MDTGVEMWERPMFLWRDKQGYEGVERVMRFMVKIPGDENAWQRKPVKSRVSATCPIGLPSI